MDFGGYTEAGFRYDITEQPNGTYQVRMETADACEVALFIPRDRPYGLCAADAEALGELLKDMEGELLESGY